MVKYIVLGIIVLIVLAAVLFFLISNREHDGKQPGKSGKKDRSNENIQNDDIQMLHEFLRKMDDEEENDIDKTKSFPDHKIHNSDSMEHHTSEEIGTSMEEISFEEEESFPNDKTMPMEWTEESKDPIFEYRVIVDDEGTTESIYERKEEYIVGKSHTADIVLATKDKIVGNQFFKIKPMKDKELFVISTIRENWVLAVWSEDNGEWEPRKDEIVFGMDDKVVIALTQFSHRTDKNISRFEVAMPGCLGEEPEAVKVDFSSDDYDYDNIFNI